MTNSPTLNKEELFDKSLKRALGGGFSGTVAMATQVGTLMWLRTTVNYQYKHGTGFKETLSTLYNQGGIRRFYRGVGPRYYKLHYLGLEIQRQTRELCFI